MANRLLDPFGTVIHGKGFIQPRQMTPPASGTFTLAEQASNGGGVAAAEEDNTVIYVGVGLVIAAGAAWWFLRR